MLYPVYCIRDVQVGFNNPMTDINDNTAKRNFTYAINNNSEMNFSAKDYDLYRVGEFDTSKGRLIPLEVPELIVTGQSVLGADIK